MLVPLWARAHDSTDLHAKCCRGRQACACLTGALRRGERAGAPARAARSAALAASTRWAPPGPGPPAARARTLTAGCLPGCFRAAHEQCMHPMMREVSRTPLVREARNRRVPLCMHRASICPPPVTSKALGRVGTLLNVWAPWRASGDTSPRTSSSRPTASSATTASGTWPPSTLAASAASRSSSRRCAARRASGRHALICMLRGPALCAPHVLLLTYASATYVLLLIWMHLGLEQLDHILLR
jgi:hypothetical protein